MDLRFIIAKEGLRDYSDRLERAAAARSAAEIRYRMRARNRLRKAILEFVKLGDPSPEIVHELDGLIRCAECRLEERPCA
jgi:hypothetical protein